MDFLFANGPSPQLEIFFIPPGQPRQMGKLPWQRKKNISRMVQGRCAPIVARAVEPPDGTAAQAGA